jgi:hypothetical protein
MICGFTEFRTNKKMKIISENSKFLSIMTEFQKLYYCFDAVKLNRYIRIDGATSLIREKWQPACLAGNLKSIMDRNSMMEFQK